MHSLLMSENDFYSEIKCNRMTSFMEFMLGAIWNKMKVIEMIKRIVHQTKKIMEDSRASIGFPAKSRDS